LAVGEVEGNKTTREPFQGSRLTKSWGSRPIGSGEGGSKRLRYAIIAREKSSQGGTTSVKAIEREKKREGITVVKNSFPPDSRAQQHP